MLISKIGSFHNDKVNLDSKRINFGKGFWHFLETGLQSDTTMPLYIMRSRMFLSLKGCVMWQNRVLYDQVQCIIVNLDTEISSNLQSVSMRTVPHFFLCGNTVPSWFWNVLV